MHSAKIYSIIAHTFKERVICAQLAANYTIKHSVVLPAYLGQLITIFGY